MGTPVIQSKKDVAFKLFDQGETALSPKVKALKLKGKTRYNYYLDWKRMHGIKDDDDNINEAKPRVKVINELKMVVPPEDEEVGKGGEQGEDDEDIEEVPEDEEEEPAAEDDDGKKDKTNGKGKKHPTVVAGQGLTFSITINTKTLMLYQIAASNQEDELTLGDFIDACVEDTYQGRGLDLGLVKIGGNNG